MQVDWRAATASLMSCCRHASAAPAHPTAVLIEDSSRHTIALQNTYQLPPRGASSTHMWPCMHVDRAGGSTTEGTDGSLRYNAPFSGKACLRTGIRTCDYVLTSTLLALQFSKTQHTITKNFTSRSFQFQKPAR